MSVHKHTCMNANFKTNATHIFLTSCYVWLETHSASVTMLGVTPFLLVLVALVASAVVSASDVSVARLSRELRKRDTASTDASEFNGKTFDYVIIGGGLAGLVARRA